MKKHALRCCGTLSRTARNRVRTSSLALLLVLALTVLFSGSVSAADGDLDTTFGDPQVNGTVYALALQPDGKVLIAGSFTQVGTTTMHRVARLNADGTLDTSFGNPQVNGEVYALALQSDGKVLIAGSFTQVGTTPMKYVARLNANGTLDTSFSDPQVEDFVYALAPQSDGKVLIGGIFISVGETAMWRVARLNTDGSLDTSFGNPQVTYQNFGTPIVYTLALQSDGKVLIGGNFDRVGGTTRDCVARLNSNGSLDTTFTDPGLGSWWGFCVHSLSLQTDGKIVMGGGFVLTSPIPDYIARLNNDGTRDTGFNNPQVNDRVTTTVLQSDGKILLGGYFTSVGGTTMNYAARLNADGTRDTAFNNPNANGVVWTLKQQSDGKALIGGNFTSVGGQSRQRVARLGGTSISLYLPLILKGN